MRRAALYLGGLILATGTTMAMSAPAQAAPAGCYDIAGYGTNIVLVSDLYQVSWQDPFIRGGFAFPSYQVFQLYRDNPYYARSFHRVYDSFYDLDAYGYGSYGITSYNTNSGLIGISL